MRWSDTNDLGNKEAVNYWLERLVFSSNVEIPTFGMIYFEFNIYFITTISYQIFKSTTFLNI